jgi:hypothetical protein
MFKKNVADRRIKFTDILEYLESKPNYEIGLSPGKHLLNGGFG